MTKATTRAVRTEAAATAPTAPTAPTVVATPTAPAASATSTTTNIPALLAYVVVHLSIRTTGVGASVARKASGYAAGRTVQECRAAGITAADIQWDLPRGNVVVAAPDTSAARAALRIAAGEAADGDAASIAAALPALIAAQKAAFAPRGTKLPARVE